ncbi:MAG: type II toxin-antitoxin system Phd/YefM family antitoxin [Fidelibacterota bacterium]
MKTLPLSEVKMKLSQIVDEVTSLNEEIIVTKNGRPAAAIIDVDEYESWKETQRVISDDDLMNEIRNGLKEIKKKSELYTLEELFDD